MPILREGELHRACHPRAFFLKLGLYHNVRPRGLCWCEEFGPQVEEGFVLGFLLYGFHGGLRGVGIRENDCGNFTTYEFAVLGVAKVHKLQRLKRFLNLLLQKVKL